MAYPRIRVGEGARHTTPSPIVARGRHRVALSPQAGRGHNNDGRAHGSPLNRQPRQSLPADGSHVRVAFFIVNNKPKQWSGSDHT
jgi:hypothetical protein